MADILFNSILATICGGGLLVGWATDRLPRGWAKLSVAAWLGVLLVMFYVGLYVGPQLERDRLLSDRTFAALVFLLIVILPFATWPLSEPPKKAGNRQVCTTCGAATLGWALAMNPFSDETELLILRLLKDAPPEGLFGLEMIELSEGRLKRGTIYVTLGRLEEQGLIESRRETSVEHPGVPRPRYRLRNEGSRRLADADVAGLTPLGAVG